MGEDLAAVLRRPVFWDENAGGWCYRVRLDRAPVQAESWAAAWAAVHAELPAPAVPSPPAPPRAVLRGPITPGDARVPVRWWHRWRLT